MDAFVLPCLHSHLWCHAKVGRVRGLLVSAALLGTFEARSLQQCVGDGD